MKFSTSLLSAALLFFAAASHAAGPPKNFADVEVKLDDSKLIAKAQGIRTLYLTMYDAASAGPRPYGAMKVELTADAKGSFYKGKLDADNVMVMGGGNPPQKIRIKARLDKDGSAGPDSSGDLVGIVDNVAIGSKVKIVISKAM